jgi:hypothetical protein
MDLAPDHERIPQVDPVRVHNGSCAGSQAGSVRASDQARTGQAGTCVSVDLCSTPYKVLRFAPTPLGAGPADLDGVCAQLATLALTCRPGSACWPAPYVRDDIRDDWALTTVLRGGILKSLR